MSVETRLARIVPRRAPEGIAAILLPFEADGQTIAVEALADAVARTQEAGLGCAVNMDTGYANYISPAERTLVLETTRQALGEGVPFVAGAYIEGLEGDIDALYLEQMEEIANFGGTPIIFQSQRFHPWSEDEIAALYGRLCAPFPKVLGFELGKMFAPNGMIFTVSLMEKLLEIPSLAGAKHSSLDRGAELERLALRDRLRPDFKIYTGNDLAIDMIEYGSDYLLGLAAFCPEKFAERDQLWVAGDEAYYALSDSLQMLGDIGFRAPVPAYKHSCAHFQHLLGRIPSSEPHPRCPRRPDWEPEILAECVRRLGYSA